MTRPGPSPGITLTNEHREKIAKSQILTALIEHAEGKREMSATQVTAGLGLLKKCLPDLAAIDISGLIKVGADQTITGLLERIASAGQRLIAAPVQSDAE